VKFSLVRDSLRDGWVVAKAVLGRPRRGKRTAKVVSRDYDTGDWRRLLDERDWLRFLRLEDYLASPHGTRSRIVDGRITQLSTEAYNREKIRHLSMILESAPRCIIEFGCGTGWNHLALRLGGYEGHYLGLDISPAGILAAQQRSDHFRLTNHDFQTGDMTDRRTWPSSAVVKYGEAICFSYLSLEQLPGLADMFVREARLQGIRTLYLFESSSPHASNWYSKLLSGVYLRAKDYQRDLGEVLNCLQKEEIVEEWTQSAPVLSPRLFNEVSMYTVNLWGQLDLNGVPTATP
jgi:SAM-dependent methyltransferase